MAMHDYNMYRYLGFQTGATVGAVGTDCSHCHLSGGSGGHKYMSAPTELTWPSEETPIVDERLNDLAPISEITWRHPWSDFLFTFLT